MGLSEWGAFKGGRYRPDFQKLGQEVRQETVDATAQSGLKSEFV